METSEEVKILGSIIMDNLSRDSAEKHYEKLLKLHNSDFLTLAQKVNTFLHDLEHEILKEITGEREYFAQLNWLKNNQTTVIRGQKTGRIPPVLVSDIENLKKWRNEAQHENNMPILKYKSHLYTMAQTIRFFSNIEWSVEMSNILNDIEIEENRYEIKVEEININEGEVPQMIENKNETKNIDTSKEKLKENSSIVKEGNNREDRKKESSPEDFDLVDEIKKIIKEIDPSLELNNAPNNYIGIKRKGRPNNFIKLKQTDRNFQIRIQHSKDEEIDKKIRDYNFNLETYENDEGRYRISLTRRDIEEKRNVLKELIKRSYDKHDFR